MLITADQGAVVTVNGGETWSSWYNQPTAQFYHVSDRQSVPVSRLRRPAGKRLASCIASRGDGGQITFRDWIAVGVEEYALRRARSAAIPNIVYGGRVMRFDRRTGQAQNVAPRSDSPGNYRILRTLPLLFPPVDPQSPVLCHQHAVENHQRRATPGRRSARTCRASSLGGAGERRRLPNAGPTDAWHGGASSTRSSPSPRRS